MPEGKVKWFNEQKGYGFIQQDGREDLLLLIKQCMMAKPKFHSTVAK